jgi:hypothetical protein
MVKHCLDCWKFSRCKTVDKAIYEKDLTGDQRAHMGMVLAEDCDEFLPMR